MAMSLGASELSKTACYQEIKKSFIWLEKRKCSRGSHETQGLRETVGCRKVRGGPARERGMVKDWGRYGIGAGSIKGEQ